MPKINVALVGCGYWGKNYVKTFADLDKTRLEYIVDSKTPKIKIPEGVRFISSMDEMLKDSNVDGVIVATPTNTHYDVAFKVLNAGKHVLVEKPITTKSEEARNLCGIAKENNLALMVGHIFRYNDAVCEVKKRIDEGEIGNLRYIEARRIGLGPIRNDVNVLWDLATHDIYLSNLFVGNNPCSVSCAGISHNGSLEDIANLTLKYHGGVMSTIYVNWEHPIKERKIIIGGTKKAILFDDVKPSEKIRIYDKGVDYQSAEGGFGEFQALTRDGDIVIPKLKLKSPLENEIVHFVDCIEGKKCLSDGYEGLETVRILEAAEESMKNGGKEIILK